MLAAMPRALVEQVFVAALADDDDLLAPLEYAARSGSVAAVRFVLRHPVLGKVRRDVAGKWIPYRAKGALHIVELLNNGYLLQAQPGAPKPVRRGMCAGPARGASRAMRAVASGTVGGVDGTLLVFRAAGAMAVSALASSGGPVQATASMYAQQHWAASGVTLLAALAMLCTIVAGVLWPSCASLIGGGVMVVAGAWVGVLARGASVHT